MLILARKHEEEVVFPGLGITVRVLEIRGGHVRLGIDAPAGVRIARAELLRRGGSTPDGRVTAPSRPRRPGRQRVVRDEAQPSGTLS